MITKKYLKSKPVCKVTFEVAPEQLNGAKKVAIAGEFNNWQADATPLKKGKEGNYKVTLELEAGNDYQFRYVVDGKTWENDWDADKYVPNNLTFEENSVVTL